MGGGWWWGAQLWVWVWGCRPAVALGVAPRRRFRAPRKEEEEEAVLAPMLVSPCRLAGATASGSRANGPGGRERYDRPTALASFDRQSASLSSRRCSGAQSPRARLCWGLALYTSGPADG